MIHSLKVLVAHRHSYEHTVAVEVMGKRFRPVVVPMGDGSAALATARMVEFDLLLCSVDLPVVTGFEVVRSLRLGSPNRHTPALLISEKFDQRHLDIARRLGRCVLVGARPEQLEQGLEDVLRNHVMTITR